MEEEEGEVRNLGKKEVPSKLGGNSFADAQSKAAEVERAAKKLCNMLQKMRAGAQCSTCGKFRVKANSQAVVGTSLVAQLQRTSQRVTLEPDMSEQLPILTEALLLLAAR